MSIQKIEREIAEIRERLDELKRLMTELAHPVPQPPMPPVGPQICGFGTVVGSDPYNPCATCPSNPAFRTDQTFVGDTPCQWCNRSGLRVTCISGGESNSASSNTNKSHLTAFNNIK